MTNPSLYFERIDIRRMPGFDDGGFSVKNLSAGVNIVYGPNASGKTTLSRAIAILLRSSREEIANVSLAAQLHVNADLVSLDCSFGRITAQSGGRETEYAPFAPIGVDNLYLLALHDLLQAEDGDLAKEILREASGGFDLQAAQNDLGFRAGITSANTNRYKSLKTAQREHRDTAREEDALRDKEGELQRLRQDIDAAEKATEELGLLRKAIEYHKLKDRVKACQIRMASFPSGVAKLLGNESKQVTSLRCNQDEVEREKEQTTARLDEACSALAASPLPKAGIGPEIIQSLREKLVTLQDQSKRIEALQTKVATATAMKGQAVRQLGSTTERRESGEAFNVDTLAELGDLARLEGKLCAETAARDQLASWLDLMQPSADQPSQFSEGMKLLTKWLARHDGVPAAGRAPLLPWLVAAGATALAAVVLGFEVSPFWFAVLLASVALVVYGAAAGNAAQVTDPLASIQREYGALGLDKPDAWKPAHVQQRLVSLQSRYGAVVIHQERLQRWSELKEKREALTKETALLEVRRDKLGLRLGLSCPGGFSELFLTAERFAAYFQAESSLTSAAAERDESVGLRDALLAAIASEMVQYGLDASDDDARLPGLVRRLDDMRERHDTAVRKRDQATQELRKINDRIKRIKAEIREVFDAVGLETDAELTLSQWEGQRGDYIEAKQQRDQATRDQAVARQPLETRQDLMERSIADLENDANNYDTRAVALESLRKQDIEIRRDVTNAKRKIRREEKLAQISERMDALRDKRETDQKNQAGQVLLDFLADKERTRDRPGVFQRARQLFTDFTNGRYSLKVDDRVDPPRFRGIDTAENIDKPLEELSSGTRLQLLIAVRLAFLEHQERGGLRIPFLLDEILANSDEKRADLFIETAIEICRQGRQVFYYTAQHDEVGKWERLLAQSADVSHKLIDLAEIRQFVETERVPRRLIALPAKTEIPDPADMDWQQYGEVLEVPPLTSVNHAGQAHLWYVIDKVDLLHHLLSNQINLWGQLENLVQNGGSTVMESKSPAYRRARAAADVIDQAIKLGQIGRGQPVDREVLMDSGVVSERFIDEVEELSARLEGDGEQVIDRLEARNVRGFGKQKLNALVTYLEEHGYIDRREVMTLDDVIKELQPRMFGYLETGVLSEGDLRWLVEAVVGRGGGGVRAGNSNSPSG